MLLGLPHSGEELLDSEEFRTSVAGVDHVTLVIS